MMKHPMYMIGLTVAAYIGWRMMPSLVEKWEEALLHPTDYDQRRTDYLNPDNWYIDPEEF